MRYATIKDLPFVFQLNLPEPAQHVYKDAFNRAWEERRDDREARAKALAAVRERFEKDGLTGRWIARAAELIAVGAQR
ncbi:MAG TPA: ChaB family protein [Thermoanaerobaculia bacterium]|nr:ChaB family protein [Thermoanaerobaculia bacterium]